MTVTIYFIVQELTRQLKCYKCNLGMARLFPDLSLFIRNRTLSSYLSISISGTGEFFCDFEVFVIVHREPKKYTTGECVSERMLKIG